MPADLTPTDAALLDRWSAALARLAEGPTEYGPHDVEALAATTERLVVENARLVKELAEMAATVRREALEEAARECEGLGRDFAQAFPEQDRRTISVAHAAYSDAALNIRALAKKEAP